MMNPMMMGMHHPMMGGMGMGMPHFSGQNSMMPSSGKVTKCQPLTRAKLCTTYDQASNKLGIHVKVARTKRKKRKQSSHDTDRYTLQKQKADSEDLFPTFKNPFTSDSHKLEEVKKAPPKKEPEKKA